MTVVIKVSNNNIVKIFPYLIQDTDIENRKQKLVISQLNDSEKKTFSFIVNGLEGEISKHTNFFKTISFAQKKGKCFGMVTHLNAGTLELCRKMGGIDRFVLGEIYINGFDITNEKCYVQEHLAMSIFSNTIASPLTGFEYLEIIGYSRGVFGSQIENVVCNVFDMLQMRPIMLKPLYTYNECEIKKISFASLFVGNIDVMITDQPTAIIDPESKSCFWEAMLFARSLGKTVIFTTDCFSEAERIADEIMCLVEGGAMGITSPIDMRLQSCKGFYVELRIVIEGSTITEIQDKYILFNRLISHDFNYNSFYISVIY